MENDCPFVAVIHPLLIKKSMDSVFNILLMRQFKMSASEVRFSIYVAGNLFTHRHLTVLSWLYDLYYSSLIFPLLEVHVN